MGYAQSGSKKTTGGVGVGCARLCNPSRKPLKFSKQEDVQVPPQPYQPGTYNLGVYILQFQKSVPYTTIDNQCIECDGAEQEVLKVCEQHMRLLK
jgi:hypothetical protein